MIPGDDDEQISDPCQAPAPAGKSTDREAQV